ncbi:MAG TPA: peroxidase family protein [Roseiflexaceae bacterium]|nr:peroxidase family protein [Roseiflexaceae bacterium]
MARKHGETVYFIAGEGFVGNEPLGPGAPAVLAGEGQPTDPERAFRFTRMFPALPALRPDEAALVELGRAMEDTPNLRDHPELPAGFTYFGQFLDHDITFDKTAGLPSGELTPEEIEQGRSPSLDLDSVYGRGPAAEAERLFERDGVVLRVGRTTPVDAPIEPEGHELPNDLPRGHDPDNPRLATIADPRNDENLAVAQLHLAFLKFHNVVAARLAEGGLEGAALFERARRMVVLHYQWIVLHDFLPRVVEPSILGQTLATGRRFFQIAPGEEPAMPVEFSVAAYRFGHSMIRDSYSWNRNFPDASLEFLFEFSGGSGGMVGLFTLPSNWPVDWRRLFDFRDAPGVRPPPALNRTRRIDTALALELRTLPRIGEEGDRASLAVRNLLRGRLLGLPSGQVVAAALDVPALTPEQVRSGPQAALLQRHQLDQQTPLWFYILKEAEVFHDGARLGPVGSTLLAETFVGLIQGSRHSLLSDANRYWRPTMPSLRPGHFTMVDLLLNVNDLNPLGEERQPPPPPPPPPRVHVVQPGDTLRGIAARFLGDARRWPEIFQANRDVIANPDLIRPGMRLVIPPR